MATVEFPIHVPAEELLADRILLSADTRGLPAEDLSDAMGWHGAWALVCLAAVAVLALTGGVGARAAALALMVGAAPGLIAQGLRLRDGPRLRPAAEPPKSRT